MGTFDDIIKDGKKYYAFARKKAKEEPMSPSPRPQADDNRGFTQQMSKEQQIEAAELTPEQVAQRSGAATNAPVQPQSGAVSVVSNGAPTTTRIVPEATPQVSPTPSATTAATTTAASTPIEQTQGEQIANYVEGKGGMPQDTNSRPSVLGVNKNDEDILREQAGVPKETPETKAEVEDKADAEEEQERKTYEQMLKEIMARRRPRTPEEEEAIRKREKRERLFASIADGLSAMHEAYSYGRGIKPMDIDKVSPKVLARQERLRLLRDQEDRAWVSNYLNVMREKRLAEKDKAYNEYKQNMLALKSQQTDQQLRKLDAEIDRLIAQGKTEEARRKQIEAQTVYIAAKQEGQTISNTYAPAYWEAKIGQANRSNNKGGGGGSKGSGSGNNSGNKGKQPKYEVVTDSQGRVVKQKETYYDENGNKVVKESDGKGRPIGTKISGKGRQPQSQSRPNNQQTTRKGATGKKGAMGNTRI